VGAWCPTRSWSRATAPRRVAERDHISPAPARGVSGPPAALHGLSALRPHHGPLLVVVGVFDGLHRGHGYLLRELRRAARRLGAVPAVLTFDHHPDEIVAGAAPPLLCDPDERLVRLGHAGVAVTIVQHFDEALRRTPYDAFVESIRARTGLAGFLMTPDAAFGHERRGTPAALAALGARDGFAVVVVPPFDLGGRQVRSTEIRTAIVTATSPRPGRSSDGGSRSPVKSPIDRAAAGRRRCASGSRSRFRRPAGTQRPWSRRSRPEARPRARMRPSYGSPRMARSASALGRGRWREAASGSPSLARDDGPWARPGSACLQDVTVRLQEPPAPATLGTFARTVSTSFRVGGPSAARAGNQGPDRR
jgi:phosphopantetheine adenylyltransferase